MARPFRTFVLVLVIGLLGGLLLGGVPARAEDPPEDPEVRKKRIAEAKRKLEADERDFAERVNVAIERGWAWLKKAQSSSGVYENPTDPDAAQNIGRQALGVYTLIKCGSKGGSKEVKKGLSGLEKVIKATQAHRTYSVAVEVLLHDALANPPPKVPPGKVKRGKKAKEPKPCKYKPKYLKEIQPLVDWLIEQPAASVWRYPGKSGPGGDEDLSNTMYAVFALTTADRCGIRVPSDVWRKVLAYLLEWQEPEGKEESTWVENPAWEPGAGDRYGRFLPGPKVQARGWSYLPDRTNARTGSMTTAGVFCLAAIRERLKAHGELDAKTRKDIDASIRCGLAWLAKYFTVDKNPRQPGWHYYYLYGLERMAATLGLKFVGKHDWYREGAEYLLAHQRKDGSWPPSNPDSIASRYEDAFLQTVFALLFLKRASLPLVPIGPVVTGG